MPNIKFATKITLLILQFCIFHLKTKVFKFLQKLIYSEIRLQHAILFITDL
jgi:hypothetical protein